MTRTKLNLWGRIWDGFTPATEVEALRDRIEALEADLVVARGDAIRHKTAADAMQKQRDEAVVAAERLRVESSRLRSLIENACELSDRHSSGLRKIIQGNLDEIDSKKPPVARKYVDDIGIGDRDDGQPVV
jgi:hypothetical protein